MNSFDVAVIGSGPGGYVAAIRCSQLGMKVALIERYPSLGGTCTNVGCIPSKALLDSSEHFYTARNKFKEHGIESADLKINLQKMVERKNNVVSQNIDGLKFLMKKNKIEIICGHGSFVNGNTIEIKTKKGETQKISAGKIIIATGSKPASLPGIVIDKKRIVTSTEILNPGEIPNHLAIIGGGVIGLELGSVFSRLGSLVSVIEFTGSLIPSMDKSLSRELEKVLKKQGFDFYLKYKVTSAKTEGKQVEITAEKEDGKKAMFTCDYCLVSVGRKPYTENLFPEKAGIEIDKRGFISVNENLETSAKGVYAIGDVIGGAMLAHKAEDEGVFVAETIAGQKPHINYRLIPNVVYTHPEVAGAGFTEEELKNNNVNYKTGLFPFRASGRARSSSDTDGFVKVYADKNTDEILGVHIIGARAADLIAEAVTAMEFRASAEDVARICHAHPTYSEAFKEACLVATENRAVHL